jgi:hypothetical protein
MDQRSVANGTHAALARILAALALLATALVGVIALPAGPAQAGGNSIVICQFVSINGNLVPFNCIRIELPPLVAWPPPHPICPQCSFTFDTDLLGDPPDVAAIDKIPGLILGGLGDLGKAELAANQIDRAALRAAALQSFQSVAATMGKATYQPGASVLYDQQSGKVISFALPWLDSANKNLAAGLASLQVGAVPSAVAEFDAAYANIAGK